MSDLFVPLYQLYFMSKFSQYNVRIPLSDKSDILYNTLSDRFIAIRHDVELKNECDLAESLANLLLKNNMLISEDIDERSSVIKQWMKEVTSTHSFTIILNPTLRCNFNCWYCYENHKNAPIMTLDVLERVKTLIASIIPNTELLKISFFGGEPLLEFSRIVEPLIHYSEHIAKQNNKNIQFSFTSNGFLLTQEMIKFLAVHNVRFMQITLDGGRNSHNRTRISNSKDSFGTITSNIEQLLEHNISVTLRINVTPENINDCSDILNWIHNLTNAQKEYLSVNIQQVWQTSNDADISIQIDNLLDSICRLGVYAYPAIMDNLRNMCYADKANTIVVNSNGNIFKCTAVDFDKEKSESDISSTTIIEDLASLFDNRINKRFANKSCMSCAIFPLCLGGCYKSVVNHHDTDYCIFNNKQEDKDKLVMTIIKDRIRRDMFSNSQ